VLTSPEVVSREITLVAVVVVSREITLVADAPWWWWCLGR